MTDKQADIIIELLRDIAIELKTIRYYQISQTALDDDEMDNIAGG